MTTHGHKRTRRDPLATRELWNGSPMAISPARSHVTPPCKQRAAPPPRAAAGGCAGGACTPVRGSCSQSAAIGVHWGTASSIGPRAHMEDFGKVSAADGDVIFGVFDGHGGKFSAEYCQDQLHAQIRAQPAFPQDMPDAIRNGFLTCDGALQKELVLRDGSGGTCAVVAVVTQSGIAVGNAGDCRAVYSCGETVLELSQDHTPANEAEAVRAVNAGGLVELGFVMLPNDGGELPITRALGDVRMKAIDPMHRCMPEMQVVSALPEVCVLPRSLASPAFLILATDGLWSVCSSAEAAKFVTNQLALHDNPQFAADQLLEHVLMELTSSDNVYITVALVKPVAPYEAPPRRPEFGRRQSAALTPPTNSPLPMSIDSEHDARRFGAGSAAALRRTLAPPSVGTFDSSSGFELEDHAG